MRRGGEDEADADAQPKPATPTDAAEPTTDARPTEEQP
jgi:hypothetical protein